MSELGTRVGLNRSEEFTESSYRRLAQKLREDHKYAHFPSVLAEAGFFPGYAFPGDPGSLALALSSWAPDVGRKSSRTWSAWFAVWSRVRETVVGVAAENFPARIKNAGMGAAFQAWSDELAPDSEEERQQRIYDLRPHPQRDVVAAAWAVGDWRVELRPQETIWWINHGPLEQQEGGESLGRAEGFRMCPNCGEMVKPMPAPPKEEPKRGRRQVRDPKADQDPHTKRCTG